MLCAFEFLVKRFRSEPSVSEHTVQDSPHPNFETCGKQEGCRAPFTRSHGRTHRGRSTRRRILGMRGPLFEHGHSDGEGRNRAGTGTGDGSRCPARSREAAVRLWLDRLAREARTAWLGITPRHRRRALPVLRFEMDRPGRVRVPVRADAAPDSGLQAVASASRVVSQIRSGQFRRA
jgi:hypothetical protein